MQAFVRGFVNIAEIQAKEASMSREYCEFAPGHPVHGPYHDTEYGFPVTDERVLFERLALEIMQAGLSWEIVLKKRAALNAAFDGFHVDKVAAYGDADVQRLLADEGIIRNRLKVHAIIANAAVVQGLRQSHGGFAEWLAAHHPRGKPEWVRLFKKTFKFTGGEITGEFLMSIGFLPGAHWEGCPVYEKLSAKLDAKGLQHSV
jgi:DNA-3-methyladenine glycosylase I